MAFKKLSTKISPVTVGLAKEIKPGEARVALSPLGVKEIVQAGFKVLVETDAGMLIGYTDKMYANAGAKIVSREQLFAESEMIVKVKEPQKSEISLLKPGQVIFSYLHLASDPEQTQGLLKQKVIGIAFETVTDNNNLLPLLTPMSQVAGKMAVQQGAYFLTIPQGGSGVLLPGVPGTNRGKVMIIGGGVVGTSAAMAAVAYGAEVVIFDRSLARLRHLEEMFDGKVTLLYSSAPLIEHELATTDMVIGAVLIPGAIAPKVITKSMLQLMRPGSILVDVAIDQGGCFETSRATTHMDPIYKVDGIIHYCVANIPGAVARTSSMALEAAILPYVIKLASGPAAALLNDKHLLNGLNVCNGMVTYEAIARDLNYKYVEAKEALNSLAAM